MLVIIGHLLVVINSSVNPIIYGIFIQKFRNLFLNHFWNGCQQKTGVKIDANFDTNKVKNETTSLEMTSIPNNGIINPGFNLTSKVVDDPMPIGPARSSRSKNHAKPRGRLDAIVDDVPELPTVSVLKHLCKARPRREKNHATPRGRVKPRLNESRF